MRYKKEISAGGIVFKSQKYELVWLVAKHSQFGHWSFPKGLVGDTKENEKMEEAALREVEEEGGVKAKIVNKRPITVKYKYKWTRPNRLTAQRLAGEEDVLIAKTVHYYLMRYISGDPKDHDWEVSEVKFAGESEIKKLLTFDNDKIAFEKAIRVFDK